MESDPVALITQLLHAIESAQWILVVPLAVLVAVYLVRRLLARAIPWIATDQGGAVLALVAAAAQAVAAAAVLPGPHTVVGVLLVAVPLFFHNEVVFRAAKKLGVDLSVDPPAQFESAPGLARMARALDAEAAKTSTPMVSAEDAAEMARRMAAMQTGAQLAATQWREPANDSERGKPGVLPSVIVPLLLVATLTSASGCAWWNARPKLRADLSACATTVVTSEVEALMGEAARALQSQPQDWDAHLDALLAKGGQAALCAVLALADALSSGTGGSQTDPLGDYDRAMRAAYLREWARGAEARAAR